MQLFYATTLLLSATLLFVVEPMFAKMVLPLLGGSPSVWNTCLVFYQAALLAGYVYAHLSVQWLGVRRQAAVHLVLLCVPWLVLPVGVAYGWSPPRDANPVLWLWLLLTVSVGLPFLCVSATAPLLQAWFSQTGHRASKDPYFLYAASNLGSMIALAAYPLIIESHLTLAEQSYWWAAGYGLLMAMIAVCAIVLWISRDTVATEAEPAADAESEPSTMAVDTPITVGRRLRWLALSAAPSSLLLGVTAHLSTDIASVPLLWVIPLMLYLLTFVLVFARRQIVSQEKMVWFQSGWVAILAGVFYLGGLHTSQIAVLFVIHLMAMFLTAMVCHGQLAADRPASSHLTEFYLWMSVGGVLGGLFNTLVAPVAFNSVLEYPLVLVVACLLRPWPRVAPQQWFKRFEICVMMLLVAIFATAVWILPLMKVDSLGSKVTLVALAAITAFLLNRQPVRFAVAIAIVMAVSLTCAGQISPLYCTRSFFGVLRVEYEEDKDKHGNVTSRAHRLLHGSTLHGTQGLDPEDALEPWTYYHRTGPVGEIFEMLNDRETFFKHGRIGVVGLGTGTIAAYGLPGQHITYFEIDPAVERIARDPECFTYLRDCRADIDVRLGDARLSLVDEPDDRFDVLLVDAFSSDAIPLHLLTREAISLYLKKIAPKGLLLVHISNRHLDLEPVLGNLAEDAGIVARVRDDNVRDDKNLPTGKCGSTWVVLCRNADDLGELKKDDDWKPVEPDPTKRLWTDDFSNIISVMDWDFDWSWMPGWEQWRKWTQPRPAVVKEK